MSVHRHQPTRPTVLVVGAGVVGASAAQYLARARPHHDVILIERNHEFATTEASSVNCGLLLPMYAAAHPLSPLERHSLSHYTMLSKRYPEITLENKPTLFACSTPQELAHAHMMAAASEGTMEVLLPAEAAKLEPAVLLPSSSTSSGSRAIGWLHVPSCASADPILSTRALAREASSAGVQLMYSSSVVKVDVMHSGRMRVVIQQHGHSTRLSNTRMSSASHVLMVDEVAICCGWRSRQVAKDLFGANVPVFPVTGQMWAVNSKQPQQINTRAMRANILSMESVIAWANSSDQTHSKFNHLSGSISHAHSLVEASMPPRLTNLTHAHTGAGFKRITRHLYARQKPCGELICGGDRILGSHVPLEEGRSYANRAQLEELLPFVRDLGDIERMWTGVMPWTADMMPILGRLPGCGPAKVFVATGLCSHGFTLGPGLGYALANVMNGMGDELCNAERVCATSARL